MGLLSVVGTLHFAESATGATVSATGSSISVGEGPVPQNNNISLTQTPGATTITDAAGISVAGGGGCVLDSPTQATCSGINARFEVLSGALNDSIRLTLSIPAGTQEQSLALGGSGDDVVDASGSVNLGAKPLELSGEDGSDRVTGSNGPDRIDYYPLVRDAGFGNNQLIPLGQLGNDTLIGNGGSDEIYADRGRDIVDAGPGDDTALVGTPPFDDPADTIACGEGQDRADVGAGATIKVDCETLTRDAFCGGKCQVASRVVSNGAGGPVLVGVSKTRGNLALEVGVPLSAASVNAALGSAQSVPATFQTRAKPKARKKKGKKKQKVKTRRVPFTLTR